jgi:hypothetical protein
MSVLELYWREQPDDGVASLTVASDLEVFEYSVCQLDSCLPAFPVEEFDLLSAPRSRYCVDRLSLVSSALGHSATRSASRA